MTDLFESTTPANLMKDRIDVFVIGGGINGAAVARDAAGRGLSVKLAEKGDYAHATSSASSKLIHGGLRYLEHYEFRLIRGSHIVLPMPDPPQTDSYTLLRMKPATSKNGLSIIVTGKGFLDEHGYDHKAC